MIDNSFDMEGKAEGEAINLGYVEPPKVELSGMVVLCFHDTVRTYFELH